MATADFSVIGLGRAQPSASEYLAEIRRRLEAQDRVGFRMHAMGTSLEGSVSDILTLVGQMHAVPLELGLPRAYTVVKLDERRDKPEQTLADKERSVDERVRGASPEADRARTPRADLSAHAGRPPAL